MSPNSVWLQKTAATGMSLYLGESLGGIQSRPCQRPPRWVAGAECQSLSAAAAHPNALTTPAFVEGLQELKARHKNKEEKARTELTRRTPGMIMPATAAMAVLQCTSSACWNHVKAAFSDDKESGSNL